MWTALKFLLCPCGTNILLLFVSYWCLVLISVLQSSFYSRFVVLDERSVLAAQGSWSFQSPFLSASVQLRMWQRHLGREGNLGRPFFVFIELQKFIYSETLHELSWTQRTTFSAGILAERFLWAPPGVPVGTGAPHFHLFLRVDFRLQINLILL